MKESVERYFLTGNNFDNMESTDFPTVLDIDLPEGEWVDGIYVTNNFSYQINSGEVLAYRNSDSSYYILQLFYESNIKNCYNGFSEMGTYICHYLESQGWEYGEGDI